MEGGGGLVVGNGEGNNSINFLHFISDVSNPFIIITEQYLLCSLLFNLEPQRFNND